MQDNPLPVNKQSYQYVILSFLASLVAAIGIVLLLEAMDDTLKTDQDVRHILEASTFAYIPTMKAKEFKVPKRSKTRKKAGEAPYAETVH
jgi:capsular polysaccharide biosynthesis protein